MGRYVPDAPEPATPRRLRLGMVGGGEGGMIGATHRMAARLDDRYALVAAAPSSDPQRARRSGEQMRLDPARVYADYREMARAEAARADGIDVVAIVVPNHLHVAVATAFLEAGIHVICDKPLATSRADGQRLLELADARALRFALTHNYSGYPLIRAARRMVADGRIGALRIVQVEYVQDWLGTALEQQGHKGATWRTDPALAGPAGCLGDIGTHAAQLAEFVTGVAPAQVSAELSTFIAGRRVDDHVQVQLRYGDGARGLLWASQVATGEENGLRLRVYGERGALRWQQEEPNVLWWSEAGAPMQRLTRGSAALPAESLAATRIPPGHPEGFIEAFAQLYRDFADELLAAIEGRPMPPRIVPDVADGVRSLAFVEAVLASGRAGGAWTDVAAVPERARHAA